MWIKILTSLVGAILLLLASFWLFSPQLITYIANQQLAQQNMVFGEQSQVRINPFVLSLSVENLTIESLKDQEQLLRLDNADAQIAVSGLFNRQLVLTGLSVSGFETQIKQLNTGWQVAGHIIEQSPSSEQEEQEPNHRQPNEVADAPWQLIASQIFINNSKVILHADQLHQFTVNQLILTNVIFSEQYQSLIAKLDAAIDNSPLSFSLNLDIIAQQYQGHFTINDVDLQDYQQWLPEQLKSLSAKVSFKTAFDANLANETRLSCSDTALALEQVLVQDVLADSLINADKIAFEIPQLNVVNTDINGQLSAQLANLTLTKVSNNDLLLAAALLSLPEITASMQNNQLMLAFDQLTIDELAGSQLADAEQPLIGFEQLAIKGVNAKYDLARSTGGVEVEEIMLAKLASYLQMEAQQLKNLVNVSQESQRESMPIDNVTDPQEQSSAQVFNFVIDKINADAIVTIEDTVASPAFSESIEFSSISLTDIDNSHATNPVNYQVNGTTNKHGRFALNGFYQPFNPKMNLLLQGDVHELSLPKLVGYFAKGAQVNILSGQLDTQLDVKVVDDQIDGETKLAVRGLELAKQDKASKQIQQDNSVISLNTALTMLQDSKGNLDLDVPLSGDVSSPEFGLQSFIGIITQKAVMMAAESYLMQTMVPYGNILSLAKIAGEMMLKVRLEDLIYRAEQIELSDEQMTFVNNLIKLMTDQDELQFKVCAIATAADLPKAHSLDEKQQVTYLHRLSEQRGQAFKNYLVHQGGIASKRLLLCHGQIELSGTKLPRIEFED
ncbi:DUF748 domain-containing protein [Thalassotalea sp. LPB0316]|uniref:DUF748 domain-containing protein n=1 Tax=Thalassotalea sp. LPB0316 TaxID=2769490 RepID=UPI0018693B96|nr:DUF748 domain-containing protein [Thalassotalea sp. LPB0316]QOL26986.1 DUF748 domain-containing protein [Thalassotalea sp. LPB0316]